MILERLEELLPGAILNTHAFRGDATAAVAPARYLEAVEAAFGEGFQLLVDLTAVDWNQRDPRFDVVVHLLNLTSQERLRLKLGLRAGEALPSLTGRFKAADWFEREDFDLFGIPFEGHPDLRRLPTWGEFPGHPLRKDFPRDGGDIFCDDTGASYAGNARSLNG